MAANNHFKFEVDKIQASLVTMGEVAGDLLSDSVAALVARDVLLAQDVISRDTGINEMEDDHEETIVGLMACNQPVARDLRQLVAFLRINAAIERAGDLAVNIAQTAIRLTDKPQLRPYVDLPSTYDQVRIMWSDAVKSLADLDTDLARQLRKRDDTVDRQNQETIIKLIDISRDHSDMVYQATNLIGVSRSLERVADLSVDISDEVLYIAHGLHRHAHRYSA